MLVAAIIAALTFFAAGACWAAIWMTRPDVWAPLPEDRDWPEGGGGR